jgi:hypothetical protein
VPELLVLAPLALMTAGDEFARGTIPLHVTVLPNVRVPEAGVKEFHDVVAKIASVTPSIAIAGDHLERFGTNGQVTVTVLAPIPELVALHQDLLAAAQSAGAISTDPQYSGDGYRAHTSHTPFSALAPGETALLTSIVLLERRQDSHRALQAHDLSR